MMAREQEKEQSGLQPGTRVQMKMRGQARRKGTVMPYEPEYSRGLFPVRFDDGIWQKCHVSDVIVIGTVEGGSISEWGPGDRG